MKTCLPARLLPARPGRCLAVLASALALSLSGCGREFKIEDIVIKPDTIPAGGKAQVALRVKNVRPGLVIRWSSTVGRCEPQKSATLTTVYTAPSDGARKDVLMVEAYEHDRFLARREKEVRIGSSAQAGGPPKAAGSSAVPIAAGPVGASLLPAQVGIPKDGPQVVIATVPRADPEGGTTSSEDIAGEVRGVDVASARIALFALTNYWYVQPLEGGELTAIGDTGAWKSWTHTGVAYAAFVVEPGFAPKNKMALPSVGGKVLARVLVTPIATFSEGEATSFSGTHFNPGFGSAKNTLVTDPDLARGKVMRVEYDVSNADDYSGFWLKFRSPNFTSEAPPQYAWTKGEGRLSLALRGDAAAGFTKRLKVELKIRGWGWKQLYLNGLTAGWQQYHLKLADFQAVEPWTGQANEFVITFENREASSRTGAVYLDDAAFEVN
jgi:hypothetical protein